MPTVKAFLAEAMALTSDLDNALDLIDEIIAQIERPGWEERLYYAEIFGLKSWMLSLKSDLNFLDPMPGVGDRKILARSINRFLTYFSLSVVEVNWMTGEALG